MAGKDAAGLGTAALVGYRLSVAPEARPTALLVPPKSVLHQPGLPDRFRSRSFCRRSAETLA